MRPPRPAGWMVALLLLLLASPAWALWHQMPWTLATIWWDLPAAVPFQSLSLDVDVLKDPPPGGRLYVAPIGMGWFDDTPFYGGIQEGVQIPSGAGDSRGATGDSRGDRIALFSRWNERSLDAIRPAPGGFSASAGYEGDFIGVRQVVPWHVGKYRFMLTVTDHATGATWVAMVVTEVTTGRTWNVGSLRFPGTHPVLRATLASFVEVFGAAVDPKAIPNATVAFGELHINGIPVQPRRGTVYYAPDVPPYAGATTTKPGTIIIETGQPHDHTHLHHETDGRLSEKFSW
ncbi:MAG: hypothetical protein HQL37_14440 [Alphaproteobacteria bacterium]|nr:hypothetical protein [Alphaproteobacteria bacterium]